MYYAADMTTGGSLESDEGATLAEFAQQIINHYAANGGWAENNIPDFERLLVHGDETELASLGEVTTLYALLRDGWLDTCRQIQDEIDHERSLKAGA
jgi:hypothetical protein